MKKSVKGIIGLSAAVVVLGSGFAVLKLTEPEDDGGSSSVPEISEDEGKTAVRLIYDSNVTGVDPDTGADLEGVIKTVDVKNRTDELHVVQKTTKTDTMAATYTLDGYQDIHMNDAVIGTLANNANGLTSETLVEENCTDLEKFGLADPTAVVDIVYETGTKHHMVVGDKTPSGSSVYVMVDDSDTVYTVRDSYVANYSKALMELIETTVLEIPEEYPTVKKLTIQREDMDDDIVLEYDEKNSGSSHSGGTSSSHVMTKPTSAYLAVEKSSDVITGMFGLDADDIYSVHCTSSDIAEAGLKDPFCTVTMECDDGTKNVLLLSEPFADDDNGRSCYCMMKDGGVIFVIGLDKVKWVTVQPVDIASRIFLASYVWNVDTLSVKCGGKERSFEITRIDPDSEADKLTSDDFSTKLNGNDFDTERYRQFYSFLISANAEDFALGEDIPKGEPMAEVKYHDTYHNETTEIEFYEKTSLQALIVVNGEAKFNISRSFVETLIENANNIEGDAEFKTTWK